MTQDLRARIALLLEFYREVEEENLVFVVAERRAGEAGYGRYGPEDLPALRLFRRAWSHMSYRQLERLVLRLRTEQPFLYRQIRYRYFDYREVRKAKCRVCGLHHGSHVDKVHAGRCKVKGRVSTLQPVVVREYPVALNAERLDAAVDWLVSEWRGPCEVPPFVVVLGGKELLRACA